MFKFDLLKLNLIKLIFLFLIFNKNEVSTIEPDSLFFKVGDKFIF